MTLQDWLSSATSRLAEAGIESARLDAQVLAAHLLGVEREWVLAHPEHPVSFAEWEATLLRRVGREPLAYIIGWREFYGRRFLVRPGVLIPRQETEILVDAVLEIVDELGRNDASVLDLGTGSGCIAITLKRERPRLSVSASDISDEALEVASLNADSLGAEVRFVRSDSFAAFEGVRFDLIACNPPYIDSQHSLMPEISNHEPGVALFAGDGGLDFYRLLAHEAAAHLAQGGFLAIEIGEGQREDVTDLFLAEGWTPLSARKDLSGIDRVLVLRSANLMPKSSYFKVGNEGREYCVNIRAILDMYDRRDAPLFFPEDAEDIVFELDSSYSDWFPLVSAIALDSKQKDIEKRLWCVDASLRIAPNEAELRSFIDRASKSPSLLVRIELFYYRIGLLK